MVLKATRQIPMPLSLNRLPDYKAAMQLTSSDVPLNLTSTMNLTYASLLTLLEVISPNPGTSLLYPSLGHSGLSSFSLFYYRIEPSLKVLITEYLLGEFNAMAGNFWVLVFNYTLSNETSATAIPVFFLPTGEIDRTVTTQADLSAIEGILAPSLNFLKELALQRRVEVDFWQLVSFIFVGYHWIMLANLGQNYSDSLCPHFLSTSSRMVSREFYGCQIIFSYQQHLHQRYSVHQLYRLSCGYHSSIVELSIAQIRYLGRRKCITKCGDHFHYELQLSGENTKGANCCDIFRCDHCLCLYKWAVCYCYLGRRVRPKKKAERQTVYLFF